MYAMVSFPDLALNNPSNSLIRYIEEKFHEAPYESSESPDYLKHTLSRSSTESDISYDLKGKCEIFSSSTDTVTPMLFVNEEAIQTLERSTSKAEKLYILNALLHTQLESFYYGNLFKILRENLNENDNEVFEITIEIHEKCINSSWEKAKDAFINLLEALYLYYCSLDPCEIHTDRYPYRNCIKICKLILNTFNDLFLQIPRFGYNRLEKIIGNFLDLLFVSISAKDCSTLTPMNVISCLDTTARWCQILTHGSCTRDILFKSIKRNVSFVKYLLLIVNEWLSEPFIPKATTRTDVIPYPVVKYLTFVNCMYICNYLSRCKSFYDLFPNVSVTENKLSLSLNSLAISLISFLKSKSKMLPVPLSRCMMECAVSLLQFQSTECVICNLQYVVETPHNKQVKKNMLEVVKRLLENESFTYKLMNYVLRTKRSRMCANNDGKLLRPRPNSVVSSRNNVFTMLMDVVISTLRNSNNQTSTMYGLSIAASILRYHNFYLLLNLNLALVRELIEVVSVRYDTQREISEEVLTRVHFSTLKRNILYRLFSYSLEKLLFSMGTTPLGFCLLQSSNLMKRVISGLERISLSWYMIPWKSSASFVVSAEYKQQTDVHFQKMSSEVLELLNQIIEHDYENDSEMNIIVEKVFVFTDLLSSNLKGMVTIKNYTLQSSAPENGNAKICSIAEFIEKYALVPVYEYELQQLALHMLRRMVKTINSRILLLCYLNYEECLSEVHKASLSESGEVIIDECSILRSDLLSGNFTLSEEHQNYRAKTASYSSSRGASARAKFSRKKLSELQKFMQETKYGLYDTNWLKQARKAFKTSLCCNIKISVLVELIEKSARSIVKSAKIRKLVVAENNDKQKLHTEDYKGIVLAVKYGIRNNALQQNSTNEENLAQLIKIIKNFTGCDCTGNFVGFDCILATLFIMCSGSVDKCLQIASYLVPLPVTVFIWPQVTPAFMEKRYLFGYLLEWLLHQEVPNVFSALSVYGISWWLICKCQLDDCFWNSMDWLNICRWFCITILYPPDNLIYFFTSVAFKNESKILQTKNENDLRNVLHVIFSSYQFGEHIMYIDYLFKKYHFYLSSYLVD